MVNEEEQALESSYAGHVTAKRGDKNNKKRSKIGSFNRKLCSWRRTRRTLKQREEWKITNRGNVEGVIVSRRRGNMNMNNEERGDNHWTNGYSDEPLQHAQWNIHIPATTTTLLLQHSDFTSKVQTFSLCTKTQKALTLNKWNSNDYYYYCYYLGLLGWWSCFCIEKTKAVVGSVCGVRFFNVVRCATLLWTVSPFHVSSVTTHTHSATGSCCVCRIKMWPLFHSHVFFLANHIVDKNYRNFLSFISILLYQILKGFKFCFFFPFF